MRPLLTAALSIVLVTVTACAPAGGKPPAEPGLAARAARVTIIRDDWGIAHVYGKTDADAVFGAIYAQAEDDFNRVETNYINAMGRLAEAEGELGGTAPGAAEAGDPPGPLGPQFGLLSVWIFQAPCSWTSV